jgi:hypothetical protein
MNKQCFLLWIMAALGVAVLTVGMPFLLAAMIDRSACHSDGCRALGLLAFIVPRTFGPTIYAIVAIWAFWRRASHLRLPLLFPLLAGVMVLGSTQWLALGGPTASVPLLATPLLHLRLIPVAIATALALFMTILPVRDRTAQHGLVWTLGISAAYVVLQDGSTFLRPALLVRPPWLISRGLLTLGRYVTLGYHGVWPIYAAAVVVLATLLVLAWRWRNNGLQRRPDDVPAHNYS